METLLIKVASFAAALSVTTLLASGRYWTVVAVLPALLALAAAWVVFLSRAREPRAEQKKKL